MSSKATVLGKIMGASIVVQEYRSIVRKDWKNITVIIMRGPIVGGIIHMFLTILLSSCTSLLNFSDLSDFLNKYVSAEVLFSYFLCEL